MTPYCYVSPAPAQKKKNKKICRRNSVELDFGVNFGWDWHFVEQAPFDPAVNKDIIQSLASRPTLSCCYRDVFLERREPPPTKVRFEKAFLLKGTLSLHILFSTALHSGYSVSCLCPRLIFQLTYSSFLPHHFWNVASDIASVQRQPRCIDSLHRPNPSFFFLSLLPRWQIIWVCCSQEPDFETNSKCVLWGVCVCIWGCLWGSDKHMCAVVWLQKQNSYCVELIRRESSMWFFLPPYTIMTLVDFTG